MKVLKIERRILDFVLSHWRFLFAIVAFICGLVLRYLCLRYESGDYRDYLLHWFDDIEANGGLKALANIPGDYNAPYVTIMAILTYIPIRYLYTVKAVSMAFDVALCIAAALIAYEVTKKHRKEKAVLTFLAVWLSPLVILNSAAWGQCDAIYGSFCLFSIYFLLRKKHVLAFLLLGAAFAFKLQTIFILPIFFLIWLKKYRYSLLNFLFVPLMDFVLCIPAILCGMPISRMITVYTMQMSEHNIAMTLNYPNVWGFLAAGTNYKGYLPEGMIISILSKVGIILTFVILLALAAYVLAKKVKFSTKNILRLVLVFAFTMTMFLPKMHERYGFVAEVLALVYFIAIERDKMLLVYVLAFPLLTYCRYLFSTNSSFVLECLAAVIVYVIVNRRLLRATVSDSNKKR